MMNLYLTFSTKNLAPTTQSPPTRASDYIIYIKIKQYT